VYRCVPILVLGSAALACAGAEPLTSCDPVGPATPLCGYQNPEDLVRVPGTRSLLVSEFAGMEPDGAGLLSRLDLDSNTHTRLFGAGDGGRKAEGWGDPACPGAPTAFSPHGIDLVQRSDGALALAVVNHAGRESIEWFEVVLGEPGASLEWRGCVVAPEDGWFNDVVALPDGGFLASHMMPRSEGLRFTFELVKSGLFGVESGLVYEWSADGGFAPVPGTKIGFANGIALAPNGRTLFVNSSVGDGVLRVDRVTGERSGRAEVEALDNSSWAEDGRLFVASLTASFSEFQACNSLERGACAASFAIVAVDPETLATEVVYESDGRTMGAGTVGLQVGDELFVGSFAGDRILRVALEN
jgi:hypothetical protein